MGPQSHLDENFIAPDGGWAWLVCIAAGISNLCIYPCLQQFGLIFRERLTLLGLSNSQITTIINTNPAVSACSGLLNGPMFRYFSFRQVAIAGSLLVFIGLLSTSLCTTFTAYMLSYACLFGFGMGISVSASSLAINTYFKEKRRRAAGFSWTITGLGPIFLPYIVTFLLSAYGVQGSVVIFASLSLHSLVSALIYQPVEYHVDRTVGKKFNSDLCINGSGDRNKFTSQYLVLDGEYEVTEPGTPMLSRANDGWFGSKLSLNTAQHMPFPLPRCERILIENRNDGAESVKCNPKLNLMPVPPESTSQHLHLAEASNESELPENVGIMRKIVYFFDLDLLRDFGFVNLVAGLTIINFGELNFAMLTPFILNDFGFKESQITLAMSTLASMDIVVRFLVPFATEKIQWDNRVFFLIGVVGIALGRTVVACTRSYRLILASFMWIGMCKGVRTIFWPLIIPGYVPLKRLPGASGLQLLISGLFTLVGGPFVGLIRDRYNYSITLHCLNLLSFVAALSWLLEALLKRHLRKHKKKPNGQ